MVRIPFETAGRAQRLRVAFVVAGTRCFPDDDDALLRGQAAPVRALSHEPPQAIQALVSPLGASVLRAKEEKPKNSQDFDPAKADLSLSLSHTCLCGRSASRLAELRHEIDVMRKLDHPNIARLFRAETWTKSCVEHTGVGCASAKRTRWRFSRAPSIVLQSVDAILYGL